MIDTNIDSLRNNIDFVTIAQFFHTFQSAFRPWKTSRDSDVFASRSHRKQRANEQEENEYFFATEDLEKMLLDDSERYRLKELIIRMLILMTRNRFINHETWQTYFSRELVKREADESNPFQIDMKEDGETAEINTEKDTDSTRSGSIEPKQPEQETADFFTFPLETKVHLLCLLCEWQLDDPERFRRHLDSEDDAVHWRVDPIGYDAKGSAFWLFDDNRLYKETSEPKPKRSKSASKQKKKPAARKGSRRSGRSSAVTPPPEDDSEEEEEAWKPWKLVCKSREEWEAFPEKYAKSNNAAEQRLYKLLVNDVVPKVIPMLEEIERKIKMEEAIVHRKRSDRLLNRELVALEQDQSFMITGGTRSSGRRKEMARKREEEDKESATRAREERLAERERRNAERIQMQIEDELRREKREMQQKMKAENSEKLAPRKRGRKPKSKPSDDQENNWAFDCVCGVSGPNIDDGSPLIACERCGTWQHIKCLGLNDEQIKNISFICRRCKEKEAEESADVDIDGMDDERSAFNDGQTVKKTKIDQHAIHPSPFANRAQPLLNPALPQMLANGQLPPHALHALHQHLLQQQQNQHQQQQHQQQQHQQQQHQQQQHQQQQHQHQQQQHQHQQQQHQHQQQQHQHQQQQHQHQQQQHQQQQHQQQQQRQQISPLPQQRQPTLPSIQQHFMPQMQIQQHPQPQQIRPQQPQLHQLSQQKPWNSMNAATPSPSGQPSFYAPPMNGHNSNIHPPVRVSNSSDSPLHDNSRYPLVHPIPHSSNGRTTVHGPQLNSQQNSQTQQESQQESQQLPQ